MSYQMVPPTVAAAAAVAAFLSCCSLMCASAVLCDPHRRFRVSKKMTWPLAAGGFWCGVRCIFLVMTLKATWSAAICVFGFSGSAVAGLLILLLAPPPGVAAGGR